MLDTEQKKTWYDYGYLAGAFSAVALSYVWAQTDGNVEVFIPVVLIFAAINIQVRRSLR